MTPRRSAIACSLVIVSALVACGSDSRKADGDAGPTAADSGAALDAVGESGSGSSSGTGDSSGSLDFNDAGGPETTGEAASGSAASDASRAGDAGTPGALADSGSTGQDAAVAMDAGVPSPLMNFFVSSDTSATGNLGGLAGADARCQRLAAAVGQGARTWRAYLSADVPVTHARDRIGNGPYYNSLGALVAADKNVLHARNGDVLVFVDEHGRRINGQWAGSPPPLEHDILTGTSRDGTLNVGLTCGSWTATIGSSFVGHTDGLGPGMSMAAMYVPWNSSHMGQCGNTAPGGGAGRIYCFAEN